MLAIFPQNMPRKLRPPTALTPTRGADVIQTNTYQANREALAVHGLAEQVKEINATGVVLAREAVPETSYIAGSIGQIPFHSLDTTVPSTKTIRLLFKEQMDALVDASVDLLVLETFVSPQTGRSRYKTGTHLRCACHC